MLETAEQIGNVENKAERKLASVFSSEKDLQNAVAELQTSGIPRRSISVIADSEKIKSSKNIEGEDAVERVEYSDAPLDAAITFEELAIARGAIFNISMILGVAIGAILSMGIGNVVAQIGVALIGGVAGAGIGYLVTRKLQDKYLTYLKRQLENGGYVLWVTIPSKAKQLAALTVLNRNGAKKIKVLA